MPETPKLPCNIDAERIVLGAILNQHPGAGEALDLLSEDDFFLDQHRILFRHLLALWNKNQGTDLVTIADHLDDSERTKAGGIDYVASLLDGIPAKFPLWQQSHSLRERRIRRMLIRAAQHIEALAFDADRNENSPDAVLDQAIEEIAAISRFCESEDYGRTDYDAAASFIAALYNRPPVPVRSGIPKLD